MECPRACPSTCAAAVAAARVVHRSATEISTHGCLFPSLDLMIDQPLPSLPLPPPEERAGRRLRALGTAALVVVGLLGGYFVTLPLVTSALWVSGSYLLFGDEGLEHVASTLTAHEDVPGPDQPPAAPPATQDDDGAAAAALHFLATYEHGYLSSDPAGIEALSTSQCVRCTFATDALHRADERDVRFLGTHFEPTAVTVTSFTPERAVVHLSVTTSDAVADLGGGDLRDLGGGDTEDDLVLVWQGDRWLVDSVDGGLWAPGLQP